MARQIRLYAKANRKTLKRAAMHKVPPNKKNPIIIIDDVHHTESANEWQKYFEIQIIKGRRQYIDPSLYSLISKADGKVISTHMSYAIAVKYAEAYIRTMENIILGKQ